MKKKKMSKIFMWMFFPPVGLWLVYGLIGFVLDNTTSLEEKMLLGKLWVFFGAMLIVLWFMICLITVILIKFMKRIIKYLQMKFNLPDDKVYDMENVWKKILFIIIGIMIPLCIMFYCWYTDYWTVIKINWKISIPYMSFYRETYHKDSGPSFFGDGTRYHVFSYKNEKYIEKVFDWKTEGKKTEYNDSYSEFIEEQLDDIGVLEKERPDYSECNYWYNNDARNEIVICWNKYKNKLYVIEHFM